jgi:hypothetical protein
VGLYDQPCALHLREIATRYAAASTFGMFFAVEAGLMHLRELTPEQRRRLEDAVNEQVVKVTHPDLADGWDVWWREDYERFVAKHPDAEQDFAIRPASLEEAGAFLDLLDPTAPTFALFSKGLLRNRYERR